MWKNRVITSHGDIANLETLKHTYDLKEIRHLSLQSLSKRCTNKTKIKSTMVDATFMRWNSNLPP